MLNPDTESIDELVRDLTQVAPRPKSEVRRRINELLALQLARIREGTKEHLNKQLSLFGGKLPFVIFGGKADEEEKIAIYRQALNDFLALLDTQ